MLRKMVSGLPLFGPWAQRIWRAFRRTPFEGSADYWIQRYATGGNSGAGSYRELAAFKAEILNDFIREQAIGAVIEFGCGDGNQLLLAKYPQYLGFDISPDAVACCRRLFSGDVTKEFRNLEEYANDQAELSLSLDVVYHLVEDGVYTAYMQRLFGSATRAVIIYSSNVGGDWFPDAPHVRHRKFTTWVAEHQPGWILARHVPNRYPYAGEGALGSFADFFIFTPRSTH